MNDTRTLVLDHLRKHLGPEEATVRTTENLEVLAWADSTDPEIVLLSSVGMSNTKMNVPQGQSCVSRDPRVELLMYARRREIDAVSSLLTDLTAYPGAHGTFIHWAHVVGLGRPIAPGSRLEALYFSYPAIESSGFGTLVLERMRIDFLWVVPISASERALFDSAGPDALEALLEEENVEVTDLERNSALR